MVCVLANWSQVEELDRIGCFYLLIGFVTFSGARDGVVVKTLRYKLAGRGFDLEFFSDIILPVALWPWSRLGV
jgi:hypothetical protein